MTTAAALGPRLSYEDGKKSSDWDAFGRGVLENRRPEIERVIEVVYDMIGSLGNREYSEKLRKRDQ